VFAGIDKTNGKVRRSRCLPEPGSGTLKEFEDIMAEIYLPSTTLRAWAAERVIEVLNRE
jgi:hypothetical protein